MLELRHRGGIFLLLFARQSEGEAGLQVLLHNSQSAVSASRPKPNDRDAGMAKVPKTVQPLGSPKVQDTSSRGCAEEASASLPKGSGKPSLHKDIIRCVLRPVCSAPYRSREIDIGKIDLREGGKVQMHVCARFCPFQSFLGALSALFAFSCIWLLYSFVSQVFPLF